MWVLFLRVCVCSFIRKDQMCMCKGVVSQYVIHYTLSTTRYSPTRTETSTCILHPCILGIHVPWQAVCLNGALEAKGELGMVRDGGGHVGLQACPIERRPIRALGILK